MKPNKPTTLRESWKEEFREYFDKNLKPKKPTMKNLDREIIVDFISKLLTSHNTELLQKIEGLPVFNDEYVHKEDVINLINQNK